MKSQRAQTATEYLIILSVVIVIALIVVGITGGVPGIGAGAFTKVDAAYWVTRDLAFTQWAIEADGDVTVTVQNNFPVAIKLIGVSINNEDLLTTENRTLLALEKTTVTGTLSSGGEANTLYSYNVSIQYQNLKTGAIEIDESDRPLEGFYAQST